jgi:hypothetical protein
MAILATFRHRRHVLPAAVLAMGIATSMATPALAATAKAPTASSVIRAKMHAAGVTPTGTIHTDSVDGPIAGCVGSKSMSGGSTPDGVVQVFFTFVTDCNASDAAVTRVGGQVTGSYCFNGVSGSGCTQLPGWSLYYTNGKYAVYSAVQTCYTGGLGTCYPTAVSAVHEALSFNQPYRWND